MLHSGRPRHEQISDWLRRKIQDGVFEPDEQIPSESQLTDRFDVSRITVRRALQTLENEGLIYRRQGLGSFVRDNRVRQGLVRLTDFVEDMAQAGLAAHSKVLHLGAEPARPDIAQSLDLPVEQPVIRLDRLRLADDEPIAFDRTWMSVYYAGLLDGHDLETQTIYHILENHYGITVERGRYRIEAVGAPADVARLLHVARGRALLLIERISFTHGEKRIYYQRRYYRSDRVAYELELTRSPGTPVPAALQDFEPVFKERIARGE